MRYILGVLIVIILVVLISGILYLTKKYQESSLETTKTSSLNNQFTNVKPSATPFLFEELTIPYLRSKEYKSTLGTLDQAYVGQNYTAYLTSYTSDGLKINGLLTKPTGTSPEGGWPAIIFVHGYIPPTQYKTLENYYSYVDYLAKNGIVVFKIDLRGHGTSEGEPGGAYYSSDYIVDVLSAYSALQSSDFVNPNKIGLWGHSMAGNVVMRSLAAKPDIPAVVIWAGAVYTYKDFAEYGIDDNSYRPPQTSSQRASKRQQLMSTYGEPKDSNPFWDLVAATNYLSDIKGAVQLNHAVDDNVVNIGYSRNLNNLLNNTDIPHEFHEYKSGGHNISGSAFNQAMQNTVEFFKRYL